MSRVRMIPFVTALAVALSLSGCTGNSSNFDPLDWISADFLSSKAPLPGDRKPVFPEGVPGVPEGVPKELVKGSQQSMMDAAATPEEPAPAAKPAAKPQAAKPAPKPRTASAPPQATSAPPQPAPQNTPADWPPVNANTSSR